MDFKEKVIESIYTVIDDFNLEVPDDMSLSKSTDTKLFGDGGKLDSLGLVNFVVATEQKISEDFDISISISDERAMSQNNSPFKSIGILVDYITLLIEESHHG